MTAPRLHLVQSKPEAAEKNDDGDTPSGTVIVLRSGPAPENQSSRWDCGPQCSGTASESLPREKNETPRDQKTRPALDGPTTKKRVDGQ